MPLAEGQARAGRLAGATLLAAALWQLTPLKSVCLRHCRSPLGFFLRFGARIRRPAGALHLDPDIGIEAALLEPDGASPDTIERRAPE